MSSSVQGEQTSTGSIHPATHIGYVHYTVADLEKQVSFYRDRLGFQEHWREDGQAGLGAGAQDLLRLTEVPTARQARRTTGLYHTAFLVPSRQELAQLLRRIAERRTPIQGMTDHGTHHAIYLPDAEGNGIELAWDFPQEEWPRNFDEMLQRNRGLAPETVLEALPPDDAAWAGLDAATIVGHVHLHVAQLGPTKDFYHKVLGFGLPLDMENATPNPFTESAIFFAAGDYHHHIGTNVWQGVGAPPPPENAIGLRHFSVLLPDQPALDAVLARVAAAGLPTEQHAEGILLRDPAQNGVLLSVAA